MSSIPILYGYIQQLQNNQHNILYDINQLMLDSKLYASNIPLNSYITIALAIIVWWCCLGWVIENLKNDLEQQNKTNAGLDPEEFDYLASSEAIPAKFNLVEAYIQMNDIESATQVLCEIIANGNQGQRNKAMSILDDIN